MQAMQSGRLVIEDTWPEDDGAEGQGRWALMAVARTSARWRQSFVARQRITVPTVR